MKGIIVSDVQPEPLAPWAALRLNRGVAMSAPAGAKPLKRTHSNTLADKMVRWWTKLCARLVSRASADTTLRCRMPARTGCTAAKFWPAWPQPTLPLPKIGRRGSRCSRSSTKDYLSSDCRRQRRAEQRTRLRRWGDRFELVLAILLAEIEHAVRCLLFCVSFLCALKSLRGG